MDARPLDPGENCCVCYELMTEDANLAYCKFSCGRNLHTDCMERWVKHKQSVGQDITCPLCRESWGRNALEELKETTKQHREKMRMRLEQKRQERKQQVKEPQITVGQMAQAKSDRSFKCTCCKRQIIYEAKYQCLFCAKVQICKLCFKGGYHNHHQFVYRPTPDKDWEPAFTDSMLPPSTSMEESMVLYEKVKQELINKKISPENYDLLLSLENK